jgi:hypothetical protein
VRQELERRGVDMSEAFNDIQVKRDE